VAAKKDNLPLSLRKDDDSTGTITYANEVIAIIAGVAANEVEGIAGMCTSGGITEVFGRNRNITKGVKVEIGSEEASVDLFVVVEYGTPIQTAALNVQENVRKAIETMTGLHVVRVDVHVQGVSFEKEKKEAQASLASAELEKVTDGRPDEEKQPEPPKDKKAARETPLPERTAPDHDRADANEPAQVMQSAEPVAAAEPEEPSETRAKDRKKKKSAAEPSGEAGEKAEPEQGA
jgi:uncharacterized alkaline shock family protein YloU